MKKILFIAITAIFLSISCNPDKDDNATTTDQKCGTYNNNQLYKGPQGGCYYMNSNGNKTYVDRTYCNC